MRLGYATPPPPRRDTAARFWIVSFAGGGAGFLLWCALDLIYVRVSPNLYGLDAVAILVFPLAMVLISDRALAHVESQKRFGLALGVAVVASLVAASFILVLGMPFHFWIGGRL